MAIAKVNGVRLYYHFLDNGKTSLVLVHGSWDSHHDWDSIVPALTETFSVLSYDRRGHSQSERTADPGSVREDVADLALLIEHLGLAPAWVVGNSFGASISLRLAGERPELFRGLIAHEPPLFDLLASDPAMAPALRDISQKIGAVIDRIASGDHSGAAMQFIETVALGPGAWAQIPLEVQQQIIENAPTFLDEAKDPEQLAFDLEWIVDFTKPTLLTLGGQSPPTFKPVVARLAEALPHARVMTLPDAGHVPHVTHPDAYVGTIVEFTQKYLT